MQWFAELYVFFCPVMTEFVIYMKDIIRGTQKSSTKKTSFNGKCTILSKFYKHVLNLVELIQGNISQLQDYLFSL